MQASIPQPLAARVSEESRCVAALPLGIPTQTLPQEASKKAPFKLDYESVIRIVGQETDQAMVYGFEHTMFDVREALKKPDSPIKKIYDCMFSNPSKFWSPYPYEGREGHYVEPLFSEETITKISGTSGKTKIDISLARTCKNAISILALENYRRKQFRRPTIPLLFCVETSDAPNNMRLTAPTVATKEGHTSAGTCYNDLFTHKELRRVYKHCVEFEGSAEPEARALSQIAKETVFFVRIEGSHDGTHRLVRVAPVWEDPLWGKEWTKRLEDHPEVRQEASREKKMGWREQIIDQVKWLENPSIPSDPESRIFRKILLRYGIVTAEFLQEKVNETKQEITRAMAPDAEALKKSAVRQEDQELHEKLCRDRNFDLLYQKVLDGIEWPLRYKPLDKENIYKPVLTQ